MIYDLIIIGAGSAGISAARKAEKNKVKTALINAGLPILGTCLNVGCIPSKRLVYAAKIAHFAKHKMLPGIDLSLKEFDFNVIIDSMRDLIQTWRDQAQNEVNQFKHIDYYNNWAKFISPYEVKVGENILKSNKIIIATGSTAKVPSLIDNPENIKLLTHEEIFFLKKLPQSLTVVGAGALGLELAQMFSRFGVKVTILEVSEAIFSAGEIELSNKLQEILEREEIEIIVDSYVEKVYMRNDFKVIRYFKDGKYSEVFSEEVLLATGKVPNTFDLNLEKAGVKTNSYKAILVDKHLQTSCSHIYAAGDVIDKPLRIKTTASQEGENAFNNLFFLDSRKSIDYTKVPYSVFTDPQLGYIGLSEKDIKDNKDDYQVITLEFKNLTKANLMDISEGEIKIIVEKSTQKIKGAHILSEIASELIYQISIAMYNDNTVQDILNTFPVFPTLSQCLTEVLKKF